MVINTQIVRMAAITRQLLTEGAGIRKPGQKIRLYEKSKTLFFFYEAAPRDKIQAEKDEGHHKPRQDG